MKGTPQDWRRVAAAVEVRRAAIPMSKTQLYERSMSESTFLKMARGIGIARAENRTRIARALGWTDDSIDRLLRREAPLEAQAEPAAVSSELAEIRRRVESIQTILGTEREEARRHGAAIERLAGAVDQLLDAMPPPGASDRRPSNAEH